MDVIKAMVERHSTREFAPTPIPRETVLKILEAAIHCPSSTIILAVLLGESLDISRMTTQTVGLG